VSTHLGNKALNVLLLTESPGTQTRKKVVSGGMLSKTAEATAVGRDIFRLGKQGPVKRA